MSLSLQRQPTVLYSNSNTVCSLLLPSTAFFAVNNLTGLTYLPLSQQTTLPFPTIAQVNAGTAYAPNTAIWTVSGARQLTAWSCVHVVISPTTGAVYIDVTDQTFAVTRNETAGTYAAGAPAGNAQYGIGKACSGATNVATLLAGTDAAMAYANVNLSGTAFVVSGSSAACSGAGSCICSCNCNGPLVAVRAAMADGSGRERAFTRPPPPPLSCSARAGRSGQRRARARSAFPPRRSRS